MGKANALKEEPEAPQWTFFMVGCFFLIMAFFVITFRMKSEESVLPKRLPPGGTASPSTAKRDSKEELRIHVSRRSGQALYEYVGMGNAVPFDALVGTLSRAAQAGGDKYSVRVSYDPETPWGDVIAVINACNKVKIHECGLIPLRGADAAPMGG